jgi:nucleoside phosphorylase
MATIGLIAAMPQESAALLRSIHGVERIALGLFSGKRFMLSGHNYILVTSGMGIRRASQATCELIKISAPRLLISFGIAGAVEADMDIGDVIMVEAVCRLDQGIVSPLLPLNRWSDEAREAAARALGGRGAHLFRGTAITTRGAQIIENILKRMAHPVLEMETAGIAQVAEEEGIPFYSLRAISDGPRAPIPFDIGEIMDDDANLRASRILMAIVRHPRIIFQFSRLMHHTRLAADNAAIALIAALSKLVV